MLILELETLKLSYFLVYLAVDMVTLLRQDTAIALLALKQEDSGD